MNAVASKIEVGRRVHYKAGYGSVDRDGVIVAVHGQPNLAAQPKPLAGFIHVIRDGDCTFDAITFDGVMHRGINQCTVDRPGIGFNLLDRVHGPEMVEQAKHLHAKHEADALMGALKAKEDFEKAEGSRVITDPPVFYWNGIKDAKGEQLQPCHYSAGPYTARSGMPAEAITIYARDYKRFSAKVRACFAVTNDTDIMVDYFADDTIRVLPVHPLYAQVKAAMDAMTAHADKRMAKWNAKHGRKA